MQVTPPDIRQSIYRKAVVELHNKIGVDYVAWMEDTATQIFGQYTLLDVTTFPETFGPRDEDPFIRFTEWTKGLHKHKYDPDLHYETEKQAQDAGARLKDPLREEVLKRHREARVKGPADDLLETTVNDPYPEYLHPREVLQTIEMIQKSRHLGIDNHGLPKQYRELGSTENVDCLTALENPFPKQKTVEEQDALDLRLDFSSQELTEASDMVKSIKVKMSYIKEVIEGSISDSLICNKWEEEAKAVVGAIPRPISPPLFSMKDLSWYATRPHRYLDIRDLVGAPVNVHHLHLPNNRDQIINRQGWNTDDGQEFIEEATALKNLDTFDGVPFPPLTPNSADVHSRVRLHQPIEHIQIPLSPPATIGKREKMPWDEDLRLDLPLMPRGAASPPFGHGDTNRLFSPIQNVSPPLPRSEDGSGIATISASANTDQVEYHPSAIKIFRGILSRDDSVKQGREGHLGYKQAEAESFQYAMKEQLDTTKTKHMKVEEMGRKHANDLPNSYSLLLESAEQGPHADRMLFVKYSGVDTALASELEWSPYMLSVDSSSIEKQARISPPPAHQPLTRIHSPSSESPSYVLHPDDAAIREAFQHKPENFTPAKPRWMTIQDAELRTTTKSSASQSSRDSSISLIKQNERQEASTNDTDELDELFDKEPQMHRSSTRKTFVRSKKDTSKSKRRKIQQGSQPLPAPRSEAPSLDDILLDEHSRAKYRGEKISEKNKKQHLSVCSGTNSTELVAKHDLSTLSGFLHLQNLPDLATKETEIIYRPSPNQDIFSMIEKEGEDVGNWKSDPALQNPPWYSHASQNSLEPCTVLVPILATTELFRNRPLIGALEKQGFCIVDNSSSLQGADLAISPSTALIVRQLSSLPDIHVQLLEELKSAATYYRRVILTFESISFSASERLEDASRNANPFVTAVSHALGSLKRGLKIAWQGTDLGEVEMLFAHNGADHLVRGLRYVLEEDEGRMKAVMGRDFDRYGEKSWMEHEQTGDEHILIDTFGINSLCARYALARYGGAEMLAYGLTDDMRIEQLGPVWGEQLVTRFNDILKLFDGAKDTAIHYAEAL